MGRTNRDCKQSIKKATTHLLGDLVVTVLAPVNILVVHLVAADDKLPDAQSVGKECVLARLCGSRTIRAGFGV